MRRDLGRSWAADFSAPHGWGPGPWDLLTSSEMSWIARSRQSGDLRPWTDESPHGGRVVPVPGGRITVHDHARLPHPRSDERVLVRCWCERELTRVPVSWVRSGRTGECDGGCLRRYETKMYLRGLKVT